MAIERIGDSDELINQAEAYVLLRKKEGRLYQDDQLMALPLVVKNHQYYNEWRLRAKSFEKLKKHLYGRKGRLLDIGCGNGWMSHALAKFGFEVTGLDTNSMELEQANNVFNLPNLNWVLGDIFKWEPAKKFDCIVLSASMQYFKSLPNLVGKLKSLLAPKGEVIFMDSFFYSDTERKQAQERSRIYYKEMGVREMEKQYFHHCLSDLAAFNVSIIYQPLHPLIRKFTNSPPFPIINVKFE